MNKSNYPNLAADVINDISNNFKPKVGIVLGSGLSSLADKLTKSIVIDYEKLPGFPQLSVKGHVGKIHLGYLNDTPVACLQGRSHTYETLSYDEVKTYVRTLKLIGCEYFIATNASGSLRSDVAPGELVLIKDHINFQPGNPLAGVNDDEFGPRFPPQDKSYHPELRNKFLATAKNQNINLHEGVYISVLGPTYETAAEINAFRIMGADVIGMSTVPEVIVANHCGLKTAVVATITNYATGLATTSHDHNKVVAMASAAADKLQSLLTSVIGELCD